MNLRRIQLLLCSILFGTIGFSQDVKPSELVRIEGNGVAVYKSSGFETKTASGLKTERQRIEIEDWTLDECLDGLKMIDLKIDYCRELEKVSEVNFYTKQKEKITDRINSIQ